MSIVCPRADCSGEIADDGFCDDCGRPAATGPAGPAGPAGSAGRPAGTGSAGSAGRPAGTGSAGSAGSARPSVATRGAPAPSVGSSRSARSGRSGRTGSSRPRIGDGLVEIAPVPPRDPADAVLSDPQVPERSRFCGSCGQAVGRARGERPGRTEGYCPHCGVHFSFTPALGPGDVVAGQYAVLGCLAHGGLGWIYLAQDQAVDDRWVVLKGLVNTSDPAALEAAIAERRFLARLAHPQIVRIYNMVRGDGSRHGAPIGGSTAGGDDGGFIVMEYLDGRSLRAMRDPRTPMAPEEALAYVLEVLPALAHLHEQGLLYCDLKPDNVVLTGTEVKLIDLGAVRRVDDERADVWGTVGYQAPELTLGREEPTVASDVYTVGRTLAVMLMNFDFSRSMVDRLPDAGDAAVLAEHDGLRRLLARACHPDPERRFASIADLAEQMTGVLRQIVAGTSPPPPRLSRVFGPPRRALGTGVDDPPDPVDVPTAMPVPLPAPDDPAAAGLAAAATAAPAEWVVAVDRLGGAGPASEVLAAHSVLARLEGDDRPGAERALAAATDPGAGGALADATDADGARAWVEAMLAAADADRPRLRDAAERVADALPGEPAATLLLGLAGELAADARAATAAYERVWRTDRSWVAAAFGLARLHLAAGDPATAIAVLDEVPATSSQHVEARVAAVRVRVSRDAAVDRGALLDAGRRLAEVDLDPARRAALECEVLEAGRGWLGEQGAEQGGARGMTEYLLDCPLDERGLAFGLEDRFRLRARHARSLEERIALVDQANDARPWTRV